MRTSRRQRRGSNAIEFAMLMPVWLAIIVAIMDFGWLFYQKASLDAAANLGCRAGALIDPGDADSNIVAVDLQATSVMVDSLTTGGTSACPSCAVTTETNGDPPARSLVCRAQKDVEPLVGMFVSPMTLSSIQVSRLEWQREAAPE